MTEEEDLRRDGPRDAKWEYVDGFTYAQAEASKPHGPIAGNILRVLLNPAEDGPCSVIPSDLKVRVYRDGRPRSSLPDIVVVGESNMVGNVETQPCLIVEVLSSSTRTADQSYKAERYRELPSLQGYLMVDSEGRAAAFYRRVGRGWEYEIVKSSVKLSCPELDLSLDSMYDGVPL